MTSRSATKIAFVSLLSCSLLGCGTFAHQLMLDKFSEPAGAYPAYGGVVFDADVLRRTAEPADPATAVTALGTCLMAVDLPLSVVGDTLLLPRWLVSRAMGYSSADRRQKPGEQENHEREPGLTGKHELDEDVMAAAPGT